MSEFDFAAIAVFLERNAESLRGILGFSKGQWSKDDLYGEACVAAADLGEKQGTPLDLGNPADADRLLRRLRSRARSAGGVLRGAERPDQASGDHDARGPRAWDRIPQRQDDVEHPLSLLEALESPVPEPAPIDPYHSETAAWNWLLHRFNRRMREIAAFLLISTSWCRERRRRARSRAGVQWQLPHRLCVGDDERAIQPWRKFKLPSPPPDDPHQLSFDYRNKPAQPASGQLWLL